MHSLNGNQRTTRSWRWLAGMAMAGALLFTGVSDVRAQSAITVRLGGSDTTTNSTPFFVALRKGWLEEAGFDAEYITIGGGAAPMAAAMRISEIDMAIGGASQFIDGVAKGIFSGKIVAEMVDSNYHVLGAEGISEIADLKGKVIGIQSYNSSDHLYLIAVLEAFGIAQDEVTWLPMGAPVARVAALTNGNIDATQMARTAMAPGTEDMIILDADDSPVQTVATVLFADQRFIDAHREELKKFLAVLGEATEWVRANPEEAVPLCAHGGATEERCADGLAAALSAKSKYTFSSTGWINVEGIETMIDQVAVVTPEAADLQVSDVADVTLAPEPK